MSRAPLAYRRQHGATLIEILVTLVILMFGLLGAVGVSSRAHMAELESYQRIQALQLVQDMASRLNANRKVASCYANGATGVTLGTGSTASSIPTCTQGTAPQQAQTTADLTAWNQELKGASEKLADTTNASGTTQAGAQVGAMIGAVGCITLDDPSNGVYLIAVAWQGLTSTAAPQLSDGTAFPCGKSSFHDANNQVDERLHRVITTKVQIGKLS